MRRGGAGDVALVRWPRDAVERDQLAREGRPRLLLVEADTPAPFVDDPLEDWLRVPADERDLFLRMRHLEGAHRERRSPPITLSDGVLRVGPIGRAFLTPLEERLVARLLIDVRRIVARADLVVAAWGTAPRSPRTLDAALVRVRCRLRPLGWTVVAVRDRGFVLAELDDES